MKNLLLLIITIGTLVGIVSCDTRRDIYPESGVWVVVNLDWSDLGSQPNGATVIFYPQTRETLSPVTLCTNSTVDSAYVKRDTYSIIVMNETVDSHSNITFSGSSKYLTFAAKAVSTTSTAAGEQITIAGEPDDLAIETYEGFEVTRESVVEAKRYELSFAPKIATKNLQVTVNIDGIDNLTSGEQTATISGMSDGFYLGSGDKLGGEVVHQVTFTEKATDASNSKLGYIRGYVDCFDVADLVTNTATLYLSLVDGTYHTPIECDVTGKIYEDEDNQLQLYLDIDTVYIDDVEDLTGDDDENTSGFDAQVGDWDDVIEVPLQVQ